MSQINYQTSDTPLTTIYQTMDYNKFAYDQTTRNLNSGYLKTLVRAFSAHQPVDPIEVTPNKSNTKLLIINGQHRFAALQSLGMPINYYVTYSTETNTTQALAARSQARHWSALDLVQSFATNPHNAIDPQVNQTIQTEYQNLLKLISQTNTTIGKVSIVATIQLANGINAAIDQANVNKAAHNWRDGQFHLLNQARFTAILKRISQLQSNLAYFKLSAATFRALFTLLNDDDVDLNYFTWLINQQRSVFDTIIESTNSSFQLIQLINFYNTNRQLYPTTQLAPVAIASAIGRRNKVVMKGTHFDQSLFLH